MLGDVPNHEMELNPYGQIVKEEWLKSSDIRPEIQMDSYIIMPNHLHGIVFITEDNQSQSSMETSGPKDLRHDLNPKGPARHSLGSFIAGFKSITTRRINDLRGTPGNPLWQRNYFEHIIRNTSTLENIRHYIDENPRRWETDSYYNHLPGQQSY